MGYGIGDDLEPGEGLASMKINSAQGETDQQRFDRLIAMRLAAGRRTKTGLSEEDWDFLDAEFKSGRVASQVLPLMSTHGLVDTERNYVVKFAPAPVRDACEATRAIIGKTAGAAITGLEAGGSHLDTGGTEKRQEGPEEPRIREALPVDEAAHRHALHVMAVNASGSVDREYASRAYLALRDTFDDVRFRHGRKSTKQALLKLMASIEAEETEERRAEKAARHEAAKRTGQYAELVGKTK